MDFLRHPPALDPPALESLMRAALSPSRALHVLGVERLAATLALRWDCDLLQARQAALLHDLTKETPDQLKLGEKCGIVPFVWQNTPPACRHALTAAALARLWGLPQAVCDAVRWHTTGRPGMAPLEKIIFLSDMAEPSRPPYPGLETLRRILFEDLDGALRLGLALTLEHARARGGPVDENTRRALNRS